MSQTATEFHVFAPAFQSCAGKEVSWCQRSQVKQTSFHRGSIKNHHQWTQISVYGKVFLVSCRLYSQWCGQEQASSVQPLPNAKVKSGQKIVSSVLFVWPCLRLKETLFSLRLRYTKGEKPIVLSYIDHRKWARVAQREWWIKCSATWASEIYRQGADVWSSIYVTESIVPSHHTSLLCWN